MNNFTSPPSEDGDNSKKIPKHLESLTTSIFQSLFPPIAPQTTPLSSIRRVLLLNREPADDGSYTLNLRHYAITTKRTGLSKPLRRLNAAEKLMKQQQNASKSRKGGLPNLGKLEDIADYMIGGEGGEGYVTDNTSGSEVDTDAEVEMLESTTRKVLNTKAKQRARAEAKGKDGPGPDVEKRAVKLVELGPRMKLRMTKVEEGVCDGKVMWHEYLHKTKEEMKELDKMWEKRRQEKALRKKIQKENVEKKKKTKAPKKGEEESDDEMIDYYNSDEDGEVEADEEMGDKEEWEDDDEDSDEE